MTDNPRFILKVLSGLHTGAEYFLRPGETRLGRSEESDLILHDMGIADQHLLFVKDESSVEVHLLDDNSTITLDGVEQPGKFTITHFGIVTTSALYLAIGPENEPWQIPPLQDLFNMVVPEPNVEDAPDPDAPDNLEDPAPNSDNADAEETELTPDASRPPEPKQRSFAISPGAALLGVFVLAMLTVAGWFFTRLDDQHPLGPDWLENSSSSDSMSASGESSIRSKISFKETILKKMATLARKHHIDADFSIQNETLLVVGYARNSTDEIDFVKEATKQSGMVVNSHLTISEHYRNNLQQSLNQHLTLGQHDQVAVATDSQDIRTFVFTGYVQQADAWNSVLDSMKRELKSIRYIDQVEHAQERLEMLGQWLDQAGLSHRVGVKLDEKQDRILIYHDAKASKAALKRIVNNFNNKYERPQVTIAKENELSRMRPEFTLEKLIGVSLNDKPYVIFDNQKHYFVGNTTADGYKIETISDAGVSLSRGKESFFYPFTK